MIFPLLIPVPTKTEKQKEEDRAFLAEKERLHDNRIKVATLLEFMTIDLGEDFISQKRRFFTGYDLAHYFLTDQEIDELLKMYVDAGGAGKIFGNRLIEWRKVKFPEIINKLKETSILSSI